MKETLRYPASREDKKRKISEKSRQEGPVDPARRLFLKIGATAAVSGVTSYWGLNTLKKWIEASRSKKTETPKEEQKMERKQEKAVVGEGDGPKEVVQEEVQSLQEIINFDSKQRVILDEKTLEKVKNHWKNAYENKLKVDLNQAWRKMGFWEDSARKGFKEGAMKYCTLKKMNEKEKETFWKDFEFFFDLAIPESHWDVWADSGVAVGPFQFTLETARDYDLKTGPNYDERSDPEKSARSAARCLLGMYEAMDGDWNLVLSGYNGGFIWKYRKERKNAPGGGKKLSHQDYMFYLSEIIEKIKKEAHFGKVLTHKVREKDSWQKIAQIYGCEEKELIDLNKKKFKKGLVVKEEIALPETKNLRRRYFYHNVKGFSENINYPAKFLAVMEVLKTRKEKKDLPAKEKAPSLIEKKIIHQRKGHRKIRLAKEDTLNSLALRFKTSSGQLAEINKIKGQKLVPGKIFLIPEEKITLLSLAGNNPGLTELMHKLNPAIQKVDQPIPDGLEIKVPMLTDYLIAKKMEK